MKIKSLLIFVFTLMSLTAFAQSGGIKGKVVSREGRVAVDGVKVSVTPGEMTATTDGRGGFVIENVEPGEYTLQFEAPEFEPLTLVVRVDKMVRDINTVIRSSQSSTPRAATMRSRCLRPFRPRRTFLTTSLPTGSARCVSTCVVTIRSIRTFT